MDRAELARLFEGAPRFLDRLEAAGPYATDGELFDAARTIAHAMPEPDQLELIDAHPRLGAPPASVSALSYVEQGYDREPGGPPDAASAPLDAASAPLDAASAPLDVAAELERLNDAYEARFGFRYCVFVAGRPREALLPGMAAALGDGVTRDDELHRALDAVVDIAIDRHARVSAETGA
ncbi:MAG: 2-oxo-4-hydroxy-4-carboxy-5-ureidoimidazoline decarboxylase [Candidatus Limnocylindria bacterium]